jgi:hypothetical protein
MLMPARSSSRSRSSDGYSAAHSVPYPPPACQQGGIVIRERGDDAFSALAQVKEVKEEPHELRQPRGFLRFRQPVVKMKHEPSVKAKKEAACW